MAANIKDMLAAGQPGPARVPKVKKPSDGEPARRVSWAANVVDLPSLPKPKLQKAPASRKSVGSAPNGELPPAVSGKAASRSVPMAKTKSKSPTERVAAKAAVGKRLAAQLHSKNVGASSPSRK